MSKTRHVEFYQMNTEMQLILLICPHVEARAHLKNLLTSEGRFCYYRVVMKDEKEEQIEGELVIDWSKEKDGLTAIAYFEQTFGAVPYAERPKSHRVRQACFRFYNALCQHQFARKASIHDLFPGDREARTGAVTKNAKISYEILLARLERKRERDRRRSADVRARKKATPSEPK